MFCHYTAPKILCAYPICFDETKKPNFVKHPIMYTFIIFWFYESSIFCENNYNYKLAIQMLDLFKGKRHKLVRSYEF